VTLLRARRVDIVPIARGSVTQIMSDAVLVLDIEDRIIDLNPAAERMIGQPLARSMGMTLREAFPQWSGKLDDLSLQPGSYSELRLGEGDLEQVYDVRISDLDNRQAQPIGRVLVLRDISERVKAEKAVQLSEEHYRALIENATDLIVIVDETVGIRFASPSVIRTFGYEMSEIVGKCSLDLVHPDDHALVANSLAEAIQTRGASLPVIARYRRADGTWRRLECIINNMLDQPAVRGVVVNARDVTEREAVAEALRQSEEKYRLHFAHINDVIYSFDQRFDIVSMSPSVERILGYKPEEFVGKSVMSLQEKELLAPGYFEKALSEIGQVLNGQRILDARYEFIAKDGALKIAEISASPVFHGDQIVGAVNVGRDVTERVQAEERLRASLQEKEFLLKEIHHRVKNNLQIVSSLLSLQSGTIDDPQIRALFRDSQNRVSSMALIHERLYRSDSLAQIDFGTYLRDLTGHLLQSYRAGDTGVRLVIAADDIHLDIDAAIPCGLVVSELVSNALKHGFPNGRRGTISVEMRNAEDAWYELVVRDDGVGFAPKAGLKPSSSLGLQLISRLTGQLGGRLDYDGTAGTTVTIRFPKDLAHQRSKGTAH
ncbi:MAG: PAS domain S-box protein, partial [Anaerolineae bacterium]|nr:PAS domain S-box protein [Anaerolineae bacterium]